MSDAPLRNQELFIMNYARNGQTVYPEHTTDGGDESAASSSLDDYNSLQDYILPSDDLDSIDTSTMLPDADDCSQYSEASIPSQASGNRTSASCGTEYSSSDTSIGSKASDEESFHGDRLPKSFLQLEGITVANFNMGCNFAIYKAIEIMIQYDLSILAIQEHTAWNKELSDIQIASIERHCDRWGYFVTVSKLQIIIFDKRLQACHRETHTHIDGRLIESRFVISDNQHACFLPVYGISHFTGNTREPDDLANSENSKLTTMSALRDQLKAAIQRARRRSDLIFVFGDLQDTPDNTNLFHYGACRVAKHPLGIVKTCESMDLLCSIYKFSDTLEKPIISRHGTKGGRFIDGTYTCLEGLTKITGTTIIRDSGVSSDHDMVISKIDLGIRQFQISKDREERINFRQIMNIPVQLLPGANHPTLAENVYKGTDYQVHAELYASLQTIINDPDSGFLERINHLANQLKLLEMDVIQRTKNEITPEDQAAGKLIQRTISDADRLNQCSGEFFTLLHDICRAADLASQVPILPSASMAAKKALVKQGKVIPGVTSVAIAKHLDEAVKRSRSVMQRLQILLKAFGSREFKTGRVVRKAKWAKHLQHKLKRFMTQQPLYIASLTTASNTYRMVEEDRRNHIMAFETARNKRIFDNKTEYTTTIIETTGAAEYEAFVHRMKQDILGHENVPSLEVQHAKRISKHAYLDQQVLYWQDLLQEFPTTPVAGLSISQAKQWYASILSAKQQIKSIQSNLQRMQSEEFSNAKAHSIRLGQYGPIARMTNPKPRSGPVAGSLFPTKPGEPIRRAINDHERQEASTTTHTMWMNDPPGTQNCHFLEKVFDDLGPRGINVMPEKVFNAEAEWKYLEGILADKLDDDIANRVRSAHHKLPTLFKQIKVEKTIIYPFRYDCESGEYNYPDLELNLRKNISKGNGKARATGFAIPVLGRLPKVFVDTYLTKCKVQMALRMLDIGTECSLRICIGKPCGGVRPLTVGHDDNVFLNGLAQQAIQKEIAGRDILPETLCSYQKGKGCADGTIVDGVIKEIALQNDDNYLAIISDDAEKMFDRLYFELQAALLLLAGAGMQGFTEWQSANMFNRTNRLVTDIFIAVLKYICGLPQGSGFSVEIANLYAFFLLLWWNMDPVNAAGTIAPFSAPRHGFPLIAGGVNKPVASLAYVDDATRFVAMSKAMHSLEEFFATVQGYCDLLADLSLVIKMGRNVRKCVIFLYNIPEQADIPTFHSIAWSYDAQGPVRGNIDTVVMHRDDDRNLICYDVPKHLREAASPNIQNILTQRKYLGVANNMQMDSTEGKEKILKKLSQRIGLVSKKADCIRENKVSHNMLVCQVATFSPICISMTLAECTTIDKQLLKAYQYRLKYTPTDAKHNIFLSERKGGIGVKSFSREYIGGLLRDIEVYLTNVGSLPTHALESSIEEATKQCLWNLYKAGLLPPKSATASRVERYNISARKTLAYFGDMDAPKATFLAYDHTHMMERAATTVCKLGFMLRDLNQEFASRLADELLLRDQYAKAIASPRITTRATLGAAIGEGNTHFVKYSLFGRIYLLLITLLEEARIHILTMSDTVTSTAMEAVLSRPKIYDTLSLFPGEISPLKLASSARECIHKMKMDYKICSFYNLIEWRCSATAFHLPTSQEYCTLIHEENVFQPSILCSMKENSENLSKHLRTLLSLSMETTGTNDLPPAEQHLMSDAAILDHATMHDLPIFVSSDGSVSADGMIIVSTSILAPDIHEDDTSSEWQQRPAKILLIRSWRLPQHWGTGTSCINMAESLDFIIGEYTIPSELPIIFITDSNNARTLQRNVKFSKSFTHRKRVRVIKQGIDYSIANHLEHLTAKWPREEELSAHAKYLYSRGEEVCKIWASQQLPSTPIYPDELSIHSSISWDDKSYSSSSDSSASAESSIQRPVKNRYRFDSSMFDLLERNIIIKVYSHQLCADLSVKTIGKQPQPNLFVVSGNQVADNAANQARKIFSSMQNHIDKLYYPPFLPRWHFAFEGSLTNKGATKVLQQKMDTELLLRQQHRPKQGLFNRLSAFNGIRPDQFGDETILRNIIKGTAPCWTRSLYKHPPLANLAWKHWRSLQSSEIQETSPVNVPKNWKKDKIISDRIKACPFCTDPDDDVNAPYGNLEHLHNYCPMENLRYAREHCLELLEKAIYNIYDFAALQQYNCSLPEARRLTALQEILEIVAKETELMERPVVRSSKLIHESRTANIAIQSQHEVKLAVLLHKLPPIKAAEYEKYPLISRLGFIQFIPEESFDYATATITDIGFLGPIPKQILRELRRHSRELKNLNQDFASFDQLIEKFICAFLYRPITVQKIINTLLAKYEDNLKQFDTDTTSETTEDAAPHITTPTASARAKAQPTPRQCHAIKCRILQAKGIIRKPALCTASRNMCSGCTNENLKHSCVARIEKEIILATTDNVALAPLLAYRVQPVSIKGFRKLLNFLPSFAGKSRNDHKFGAARYVANSLGVLIVDTPNCNLLDSPMTTRQCNNIWRQARLHCKCCCASRRPVPFKSRVFCMNCQYLILHTSITHVTRCPGCDINDSWETLGALCLACQMATIIYRNPFQQRFQKFIADWLPNSDDDHSDSTANDPPMSLKSSASLLSPITPKSQEELLRLRQLSIEKSFLGIKAKSSCQESKFIFENLNLLQKDLQRNFGSLKRDSESQSETTAQDYTNENLSPRKKLFSTETPLSETTSHSQHSAVSRMPLFPIDLNCMSSTSDASLWKQQNAARNKARTIQAKLKRAKDTVSKYK